MAKETVAQLKKLWANENSQHMILDIADRLLDRTAKSMMVPLGSWLEELERNANPFTSREILERISELKKKRDVLKLQTLDPVITNQ